MKNRQHEFIMRAFLESKIPLRIKENMTDFISIDADVGGYCTQLIKHKKKIECESKEIIPKSKKQKFSELINNASGSEKDEMIMYYRLIILVEAVLEQYMDNN